MIGKEFRKVYIIESPSPQDILDGRREGLALSEILTLAAIKNSYYQVSDFDTLLLAFHRIILDINQKDNRLGVVDLHFSMHGNSQGLGLSSGQLIEWQALAPILNDFNNKVGYMEIEMAPGKKYGSANLNFSVCHGFNATLMKEYSEHSPFTTILGPIHEVNWSDSLMAFAVYYHNTIHKGHGWRYSAKMMNATVGLNNVFKLEIAEGLEPAASIQ
ncbi:MAG: hypothetical protein JNL72_02575 [Flavipsychrobacter sp.]|nr:hypothetical protein [Flavipsychrobacter sp.]